jgi:hypothetical protein
MSTTPTRDHKASPPESDMVNDTDLKAHAEASEYLETGVSAQDEEFRRKEKALVRKLDLFIAPVMMMLMLISYLDRGNIGFAATQGMAADIGLKGNQLNVCLILIYIDRPSLLIFGS